MILVVEDDAEYRWMIAARLREEYEVLEASNGHEGFEKALEMIPDLIVADLMMPIMDGIRLCQSLKMHPFTSHIPVVMLTAKTSVESQIEGFEAGADDYVTKPFEMQLLKVRIRNLLAMRHRLQKLFSTQMEAAKHRESPDDAEGFEALDLPQLNNPADREFWKKTCVILKRHFGDVDFSVDSWAEELGMSERSLQRKIKALSDRTPVQLLAEYRLKQAAKLLLSTSLSITEVSMEAGFSDLSHFCRLFKRMFGKNPSQYRE